LTRCRAIVLIDAKVYIFIKIRIKMKVCFPVECNNGIDSQIFNHFGSAPVFVIFDTETEAFETVDNQDLGHSHGMCSPLKALNGKTVDAIVVGGIGAGAVSKLNEMGITAYKAAGGSIKINVELLAAGKMVEITQSHACQGHNGGCSH
jgi:predicted Fe-Mo cluster-binding NifX family protein